jgi:hypothetical protein
MPTAGSGGRENSKLAPRFAGPKPATHPFFLYDAAASRVELEES